MPLALAGRFLTTAPSGKPDTVIYNKKYIFGLHPVHGTKLPWNFLNVEHNKSVFCDVYEVTFGIPLGNIKVKSGCQEYQNVTRSLELSVQPLTLGERRWRKLSSITNGQSRLCNDAFIKTQKVGFLRAFILVSQKVTISLESSAPQTPLGQKLLCSGPFQVLPYVSLHLAVHLCPFFFLLAAP